MVERPLSVTSPSCLSMRRTDFTNKIYGLLLTYQSGCHIKSKKNIGRVWPNATIASSIVNNSVQTR